MRQAYDYWQDQPDISTDIQSRAVAKAVGFPPARARPPSTNNSRENGVETPFPSRIQLRELNFRHRIQVSSPEREPAKVHVGCFPVPCIQCTHRREEPIFIQTVCTSISPGRNPENRARCLRRYRTTETTRVCVSRPTPSAGSVHDRARASKPRRSDDNHPTVGHSSPKPAPTRGVFRCATRGVRVAKCLCLAPQEGKGKKGSERVDACVRASTRTTAHTSPPLFYKQVYVPSIKINAERCLGLKIKLLYRWKLQILIH